MRLLFLILLLANAGAYGYIHFSEGRAGAGNQIMLLQIAPEKMKLLKPGTRPLPSTDARAQSTSVCLEWSGFAAGDSLRAGLALERVGLRDKVSQRETGDRFWVYIPPFKTQAELDKTTGELKSRGIADFSIVQDNSQLRNAIALGDFQTDEAANNYVLQLREKGVRSALAGVRGAKTITFVIRDPGDVMAAKVAELKGDFPAAQLKVLACADAVTAKN